MANDISTLSKQVVQVWKQFGPAQRVNILLALAAAIGIVGALVYWGTQPDYRLLYSDLTLADSARMREKLEESKIPVKLGQSGMSISVPASELYSARLLLAADGLPQDSSSGFELFEEPRFGLTDFAQKVNYQRALQGELERTITAMQGIRSARVMLVLPKDQLFASDEERKAQASILLNLNGSLALSDSQVQSIVHLVSGSVQSLAPADVVVTDQSGRMLTRVTTTEDVLEQSNEQLALQERTEKRLEEKAQALLDRAMGAGNSIVRVSVRLDFSTTEQEAQLFDAENKVATSERVFTEDQTGNEGSGGGPAGMMANVTVSNPDAMRVDEKNRNKKEELLTEYVVPSTVSRTQRKGVSIEQMSVAVCLAKGDEKRSEAELESIQQLIVNALGVTKSRSDSIEVSEMAFTPVEPTTKVVAAPWWMQLPVSIDSIMKALGGLTILGVVFGVGKRVKAAMLASAPQLDTPIEELQRQTREELASETPLSLQEQLAAITEMARENPKTVANWISNSVNWNE